MRTASLRYGNSSALTTKPDRSAQTTPVLSSFSQTARAVAVVDGAVRIVCTISTSDMTGAGLKKCSPTTSAGRPVAIAHSMTGRLEVVVASTTPGLQISSNVENRACLTLRSSTTASTTRSTPARSSIVDDQVIRSRAASLSCSDSLPRTTPLSRDLRIVSASFAVRSGPRVTAVTAYPALAKTSTMPPAIVPEPTTPTVDTGRAPSGPPASTGTGVSSSATTTGEPGPA